MTARVLGGVILGGGVGVWGELVLGGGGAAAGRPRAPGAPRGGVRPGGAHGCAAGSCALQGLVEGQGPGRGGPGACV